MTLKKTLGWLVLALSLVLLILGSWLIVKERAFFCGDLGLTFGDDGRRVVKVTEGGPSAGTIEEGDMISAINGRPCSPPLTWFDAGEPVSIAFERDGEKFLQTVTAGPNGWGRIMGTVLFSVLVGLAILLTMWLLMMAAFENES